MTHRFIFFRLLDHNGESFSIKKKLGILYAYFLFPFFRLIFDHRFSGREEEEEECVLYQNIKYLILLICRLVIVFEFYQHNRKGCATDGKKGLSDLCLNRIIILQHRFWPRSNLFILSNRSHNKPIDEVTHRRITILTMKRIEGEWEERTMNISYHYFGKMFMMIISCISFNECISPIVYRISNGLTMTSWKRWEYFSTLTAPVKSKTIIMKFCKGTQWIKINIYAYAYAF